MEHVDNAYRRLFCPLCNSSDVFSAGRLKYSSPVLFSSHIIRLSRIPELWKCNACLSWYSNNILPENIAADLYARGISGDRWSQEPVEEGKSREIIKLLTDNFYKGKRVLDIGCNTGVVLDIAIARGCVTAGIEFSTACHDQLRSKGHKYFSDLKEVDGEYDVIIAFDIIEHIYNLPLLLALCNKKLADKGVLLILTGDIHSLSARLCGPKWWYVNYPEHIIFPSRKYLHSIAGFKVVKWIKTYAAVNYRHPVHIIIRRFIYGIHKKNYTGLPSIGPDHILICLEKNKHH